MTCGSLGIGQQAKCQGGTKDPGTLGNEVVRSLSTISLANSTSTFRKYLYVSQVGDWDGDQKQQKKQS